MILIPGHELSGNDTLQLGGEIPSSSDQGPQDGVVRPFRGPKIGELHPDRIAGGDEDILPPVSIE